MVEVGNFNKYSDLSFQEAQLIHNLLRDNYETENKLIADNKKLITYILIGYVVLTSYLFWNGEAYYNNIKMSWMLASGIMGLISSILSISTSVDLFGQVKNVIHYSKEGKTLENTLALSLIQRFFSRRAKTWGVWSFSILLMPTFLIVIINTSIWILFIFSFSKWVGSVASLLAIATGGLSLFLYKSHWFKNLQN